MAAGIVVPVPKDPGGGYTHEQHKRNQQAIQGAGALYRLTGDRAYAEYARDMLLAYARLYPTLGPHPARRSEQAICSRCTISDFVGGCCASRLRMRALISDAGLT